MLHTKYGVWIGTPRMLHKQYGVWIDNAVRCIHYTVVWINRACALHGIHAVWNKRSIVWCIVIRIWFGVHGVPETSWVLRIEARQRYTWGNNAPVQERKRRIHDP